MDDIMLNVEYVPVGRLKPYDRNARKHTPADLEKIENSIKEFGFLDPIGVWSDKMMIVEGHGRLLAAKKLGMDKVPIIRLDHLTDEQRRAYALAHNKIAELSAWDTDLLNLELDELSLSDIDMSDLGFDDIEKAIEAEADNRGTGEESGGSNYSEKVKIPQYQPKGECPKVENLVSLDKTNELISEINDLKADEETKKFLIAASYRHAIFDYRNIAEFYCHQTSEVQNLMEKSALVIIDINDAIANGYVKLTKKITEILEEEQDD